MLQKVIQPCLEVLFPRKCAGCHCLLHPNEQQICLCCSFRLPRSPDLLFNGNEVARMFSHRLHIVQMYSWLSYREGGLGSQLLKQVKYGGKKDLGTYLGSCFYEDWSAREKPILPDVVVPIPLTGSKLRKRGYNQSEAIAHGWCNSSGAPLKSSLLKRVHQKKQQTQLSRLQRFENVKTAFKWDLKALKPYSHIMIFDDTTTTGATLEAAAIPLVKKGIKVSFATLAYVE